MSLYGVNVEFTTGMELVDEEKVKEWRIGQQLVYALLVQAHYPNHESGLPVFEKLMKNLGDYIEDETSIDQKDVIKCFDILVKENKPDLLAKILNNRSFPNSSYTGNIAKNALKQAIRVGSIEILDFLIQENVQIISNNRDGDDNKNKYDEIRSLIFNILQSVRIGHNNSEKPNNLIIANKFWRYLAKSLYELYKEQDDNNDDLKEKENAKNNKDNESNNENENEDQGLLKYDDDDINDDLALMRYNKFIISNPLIICSIYKYIYSSLSGKHYISKLTPILHFICENYMSLDDKQDLETLHGECQKDKLFDCSSLKSFNIKYGHALHQEYYKTKQKRNVKLFWTEYIMIKLINDFLGIEPYKMNTKKRMNQYGNLNINKDNKKEREEMLYCIKYIISNGAANHLNDIKSLLNEYELQFIKNNDDKKELNNIINAIEYGKNIWTLKIMKKNDINQLFDNICNNQIELPLNIAQFIISFVVL